MKVFNFKSHEPLTPFAPQWDYSFGYEDISKFINCPKIAALILSKEKEIIKIFPPLNLHSVDGYTHLGPNSLTSRYSYYNLLDWPGEEIKTIKKKIIDFHKRFLKKLNIKIKAPIKIKAWANVMRKGEKINPHIHTVERHAYLSGHLNIQCENTSTFYMNPVDQLNDPQVQEIKNEVGEISLFPTCMPHYTNEHQGFKERITIAFDISLKT